MDTKKSKATIYFKEVINCSSERPYCSDYAIINLSLANIRHKMLLEKGKRWDLEKRDKQLIIKY
jgi:hypothetical protein